MTFNIIISLVITFSHAIEKYEYGQELFQFIRNRHIDVVLFKTYLLNVLIGVISVVDHVEGTYFWKKHTLILEGLSLVRFNYILYLPFQKSIGVRIAFVNMKLF